MLGDYELMRQLCEKRNITLSPDIVDAIKAAGSTGQLQLSAQSILIPVCDILGRVLSSSTAIRSVDLSDCVLVSKGLSKILDALLNGSNITTLNLKGNNISGENVALLGEIFHRNNTLKHLFIEWNCLGTDTEAFVKFCDGLGANHNIEELDLRYNQISPYCGEALSKLFKRNKSLRIVNLAWNTIGLQGGQSIFNGMKENHSITKLNLRGNCIPEEIIEAIEDITYKNQSRNFQYQKNVSKSKQVSKTVLFNGNVRTKDNHENVNIVEIGKVQNKRVENTAGNIGKKIEDSMINLSVFEDRSNQIESNTQVDEEFPVLRELNPLPSEMNSKISDLNKILQERSSAINILTEENSAKKSEIEKLKSTIHSMETEMSKQKTENDATLNGKMKEITEITENLRQIEENWSSKFKELEKCNNLLQLRNNDWEMKAKHFERDNHKSSLDIIALKEKLMVKSRTYQDVVSHHKTEVHKLKMDLKENQDRHKMELNVLKNTLRETTQALEECQNHLEKNRAEVRVTNETLSSAKSKLIEMDHITKKYSSLEGSMEKLREEKIRVDEKLLDSQRTIASLKRQMSTLQGELIEPQRRYDLLKDELDQEKLKCERLKLELNEERAHLREQNGQIQKLSQQMTTLNLQLIDIQKTHADSIRDQERERKQLKELIISKERDLNDFKTEEAQRIGQLYAAFNKYLGSIGPNINELQTAKTKDC